MSNETTAEDVGQVYSIEQVTNWQYQVMSRCQELQQLHTMTEDVLEGRREPPVVRLPIQGVDGTVNWVDFDLRKALPTRVSEEERARAMADIMRPWREYFADEWRNAQQQLGRSAVKLIQSLDAHRRELAAVEAQGQLPVAPPPPPTRRPAPGEPAA